MKQITRSGPVRSKGYNLRITRKLHAEARAQRERSGLAVTAFLRLALRAWVAGLIDRDVIELWEEHARKEGD